MNTLLTRRENFVFCLCIVVRRVREPVAYLTAAAMASVFVTFRDSLQRRRALAAEPGAAERYVLFGLDQLRERGFRARHNLERAGAPPALGAPRRGS